MKRFFAFFAAAMMSSLVGCSLLELPITGPGNEQEEEQGNNNTGSEIPATVAITRATATTAKFEGEITNDEVDLDFVQITLRYAEPEVFSAMDAELPCVVVTRPNFDSEKKFAFRLEDLKHNTSYKFCAIVQYKNDVFYSDVQEFKTAGVNVNLAVKDGSATDNSVELIGNVDGISKEDADKLEVGLYYSPDKSLVEKGEGTKVVLDNVGEDGAVLVSLTDLYMDGPTYYFCGYVKQGDSYDLGKTKSFELTNEPVRLVKKITRTEKVLDNEMVWTYEFEYENNKLVGSKWTEEEEDVDGYRFTYDYSTKGKVVVGMYYFDESGEELEQTYEIAIDAKGNALDYNYTNEYDWGDYIEYYHHDINFTYTPEGYLASWSETDGEGRFGLSFDYVDGRLNRVDVDYGDDDEDVPEEDKHLMVPYFSGNVEMKNTSYDLNKVLYPYFIENEIGAFSAVKTGTIGKYYLDQMLVESCWYVLDNDIDEWRTTTDANYMEVVSYSTYELEGYNDDFGTFPVTSVKYDKDGYPTEFVADVRGRETIITAIYGASEVAWVDEWEGVTYYYIREISKGSVDYVTTSFGQAKITVEYCD